MEETPWVDVHYESDHFNSIEDFFCSIPKNFSNLFDDIIAPPFSCDNVNLPNDQSGEGRQATLSQASEAEECSIINPRSKILGKRERLVTIPEEADEGLIINPRSKILGKREYLVTIPEDDDDPLKKLREEAEAGLNPLAEIFGKRKRSAILQEEPLKIFPESSNRSYQFYGAKGSVANPSDDDCVIPIVGAGKESTFNPLAEIFGRGNGTAILGGGGESSNNPEIFRQRNMLSPLLLEQFSQLPSYPGCKDCEVLKVVIYFNHMYIIKLEIHGKWGVICHSLQKCCKIVSNNLSVGDHVYEKFDFSSQSRSEVKYNLIHYCKALKDQGYIKQPDPMKFFLQDFNVDEKGDEWEEVFNYPKQFLYEELGIRHFSPEKSNANKQLHNYKASQSSKEKGKGKSKGKEKAKNLPPKCPRISPKEQEKLKREVKMREMAAQAKGRAENMSLADLRAYFHFSIEAAAEEMKIPVPFLKKIYQKFGISKWPDKKHLAAIVKDISILQPLVHQYKSTRVGEYVAARIEVLEKEKAILFSI